MKRQILISLVILLSIETSALSTEWLVGPRDYPTIQSAIDVAVNGDVVIVPPGVYTGHGNVDLDFSGGNGQSAITVRSQINPDNPNWDTIAATIIDCGGNKYTPHRAFHFHSGEGPNSKVLGFTIRNGYARGDKGKDGIYGANPPVPYESIEDDPNGIPRAERGQDSPFSNGYGGAILCDGASPTIKYCVITDCTVTGGQGGNGASGLWGPWFYQPPDFNDPNIPDPNVDPEEVLDGQWGGNGGTGSGYGSGGGIACMAGSSPLISDCTIKDNKAQGGCGGDGGDGGNAAEPPDFDQGNGSFGGDGGISSGDGLGGGIYCENGSKPTIVNCIFNDNIAMTGARAEGGQLGQGNVIPEPDGGPATDGASGLVYPYGGIAGGAVYYNYPSEANLINCTFTGNKAYEAYEFFSPLLGLEEDISAYTVGGALYSNTLNTVTLNTCDFINNTGGAVYCGSHSTVNINNNYDPNHRCLFMANSDPDDGGDLRYDIGIDFGSGGAVYIGTDSSADIQNCFFSGNSAKNDGGALKCESDINLKKCSFGNNNAENGYGGATDVYTQQAHTPLTIDANNCIYFGNQAPSGGGFSSENFKATFTDCYFFGNDAEEGGGLHMVFGDVTIDGGIVKNNAATDGYGGGLHCESAKANIKHCTFMDNLAYGIFPYGGSGAAINFKGPFSHRVFNCLLTGNSASVDGGAIYCYDATPEISSCTFDDDFASGFGGAIFSDWQSQPEINDCIFQNCNSHAIHEEDYGGDAIATFCLFYNNPDGDYYDSGTGLVYTGAGQVGSIPGGSNNLYGDPLFVSGGLGEFYLSQIAAGQAGNSPAWDSGSDTAVNLGLDAYTTRTDNVGDAGQVDRGYHYRDIADVGTFQLTASVIGGHGTIEPTSGTYYAGTIVTLTAKPNAGWWVKAWTGTDDDTSTDITSTVVMNADRAVTVEFRQPRTLLVSAGGGEQGYYSDIQDAVLDANDGDTIVVYAGTYYSAYLGRALEVDRAVLITSRNPDDPCCVAATIIDGLLGTNEHTNVGVRFTSNAGAGTVLNGFTIQNCGGRWGTALDGDRTLNHPDGYDGGNLQGPAIYVEPGATPTIKNCVIRDNWILGGFGGDGEGATNDENAGRGGWGGWARGGAVYCAPDSSATFINCRIIDNTAIGGDGGDGGDDTFPGGEENYGGNWSRAGSPDSPALEIDPFSLDITPIVDGDLWEVWGYFGAYRWYSGYGGGAYCDIGSNITFIHCEISGNLAQGGMSGQGGEDFYTNRPIEPLVPYEIPSFGGGVYCAAEATVTFADCTITDNISSPPALVDPNDPDSGIRFHLDPYLGHGGGVCAEDTATVIFNSCEFSENEASVGGGVHWANANPVISDCNFTFNSAFHGGGLFGEHGPGTIIGCDFTDNEAVSEALDPNVYEETLGAGGGMHLWATDVNIIDCNIINNRAETSGGGVYFGGENNTLLFNCLITDNFANRGGGGISANRYSDVNIVNCTIVGNTGLEYGGGVHCSYYSYANIINSIIYSNTGINGSQLAVATGFEYSYEPSVVDVFYSDIGVPDVEYGLIDANGLPTIRSGFDVSELAANDDQSTGLVDIGFEIDFFGKTYSQLYVNNNGNVTFDANMWTYTPFGLTGNIGTPIIASFFADIDTRPGDVDTGVLTRYGTGIVDGHAAFGVTWIDVGYFDTHWDKLNGFQLILIDRSDRAPGDFDIEFNYEEIQWETGDASGGDSGFGGDSARAGFSNGTGAAGTFYEFEGSGVPGAFLDSSSTGLIHGSRRSAVDGRYIFAVQRGLPELLPTVPIYVDVNCTLGGWDWDADTNNWEPNFVDYHNISDDPCFATGYFLSQVAAGQDVNSPCLDVGSDLASVFGLDTYTTRTDSFPDTYDPNHPNPNSVIVDMGYHYNSFTVPQYQLTFRAVGTGEPGVPVPEIIQPIPTEPNLYQGLHNWYEVVKLEIMDVCDYQVLWTGTDDDELVGPNNTVTMDNDKTVTVQLVKAKYDLTIEVVGGNGRLFAEWLDVNDPCRIEDPCENHPIRFGTVVQLTAEPDEGYRVKRWSGTDDDISRATTNTVTMDFNKTVTVVFGPPVAIIVPEDYATIQDAIFAAEAGDTIVVYPGTYYGPGIRLDKSITIRSEHPDDPRCVAETVIDRTGYANRSFTIYADGVVLNGLTIQNCSWYVLDGENGSRQDPCHPDGYDGIGAEGAALYINGDVSGVVKNCIFRNNWIRGGHGGNGEGATDVENAGRGGWGGWARGGAIYCGSDSDVEFINCQIIDNTAIGGNGGNGGNYQEDGGTANYGGSWSTAGGYHYDPYSLYRVWVEGDLWQNWGYIGNYRWYSGYGGGVYCDVNSTVDFNSCTISGNITQGGMSGEGGDREGEDPEPEISYEIPSYGGGVYCAAEAFVTFNGCTITDNISSPPEYVDPNNPNSGLRYRIDPYVGHGGGVCAENTASVVFIDTTLSENGASLGAGTYWVDTNPSLIDCNIVDNQALTGGGVYFSGGSGQVVGTDFSGNDANGPAGAGGAMYCFDVNALIADCNISYNDANSSGGGIYITGSNTLSVENCLITNNMAGRDGGGISANWYSEPIIANCSVVGNQATGNFGEFGNTGFGGGLYCSYESNSEVIDCIFWDNYAFEDGAQIAMGTDFVFGPGPATLTVTYSDIQGGRSNIQVDSGCNLVWDVAPGHPDYPSNINADPLFVTGQLGDYYLSQTDVNDPNQSSDSPCVDAGSDYASHVGMNKYTTRTDGELDIGTVDMGYHYHYPSIIEVCGLCNFFDRDAGDNPDGLIDFKDFAMFAVHWLEEGCSGGDEWCQGADLTFDTIVDYRDLAFFVECWLVADSMAPEPDPSEWEIEPHSTSMAPPYPIGMTAKAAIDGWGWGVEYYFECVTDDVSSGWQDSRTWQDTGLTLGITYGYRVKAKDELDNETGWSDIGYAVAGEDTMPPTPDPMTWETLPYSASPNSIAMVATTADDDSGVEYYFDTNSPGAHDSDWIDVPSYVDVDLVSNTEYGYRVRARDKSTQQHMTDWSVWAYATPGTPPTPDPMQWDMTLDANNMNGEPHQVWLDPYQMFTYGATMRADPDTSDDSEWFEFKFECRDNRYSSHDPEWIHFDGPPYIYTTDYLGSILVQLEFRVKARDIDGIETGWSKWMWMVMLP